MQSCVEARLADADGDAGPAVGNSDGGAGVVAVGLWAVAPVPKNASTVTAHMKPSAIRGRLSDRRGRRPDLGATCTGTAFHAGEGRRQRHWDRARRPPRLIGIVEWVSINQATLCCCSVNLSAESAQ